MKIKFYIVTYKREDDLNKTLNSLFASDINNYNVEVYIVNNHSQLSFASQFKDKVTVLHNTFRPDNSTGHLSRNYNEIFLHGFKSLAHPDCDILIHSHDDNTFDPHFFTKLLEYHKKCELITFSQGCGLMSYTAEAVKQVGMWDERFCTIGYHEGDYFLRAIAQLKEKVSINDPLQGREWNPLPWICTKLPNTDQNAEHQRSFTYYPICRKLWELKYPGIKDVGWSYAQMQNLPSPSIDYHVMYPYFEKDLYNLSSKYFSGIDFNGRPFL
tara:strand:+ start:517 stop:1326 length:810 start_codon:yes stop_codon:yes gene_type:complete